MSESFGGKSAPVLTEGSSVSRMAGRNSAGLASFRVLGAVLPDFGGMTVVVSAGAVVPEDGGSDANSEFASGGRDGLSQVIVPG